MQVQPAPSRDFIPLLNWPRVKEIIEQGQLHLLGRSEDQQKDYDAFRKQCSETWNSVADFVLVNKFGFKSLSSSETGKLIADKSDLQLNQDKIVVLPNDFPYHFASDIKHFIVWKIGTPLTDEEIQRSVEESKINLGNVSDFVTYVNPLHLKSIPDVDHGHVLFFCNQLF